MMLTKTLSSRETGSGQGLASTVSSHLEDFLADLTVQQDHALSAIGLAPGAPRDSRTRTGDVAARLQRVTGIARSLNAAVLEYLRHDGATAEHFLEAGPDDRSKKLRFRWKAPVPGNEASFRTVEFRLNLRLRTDRNRIFFESSAELSIGGDDTHRQVAIDLPRVEDESADSLLASQAVSALAKLAIDISRAH